MRPGRSTVSPLRVERHRRRSCATQRRGLGLRRDDHAGLEHIADAHDARERGTRHERARVVIDASPNPKRSSAAAATAIRRKVVRLSGSLNEKCALPSGSVSGPPRRTRSIGSPRAGPPPSPPSRPCRAAGSPCARIRTRARHPLAVLHREDAREQLAALEGEDRELARLGERRQGIGRLVPGEHEHAFVDRVERE